jgi:hypothetical protein
VSECAPLWPQIRSDRLMDCRTTHLLLDSEDRVIGILGGQPKNAKEWERVSREAAEALEDTRGSCSFSDKQVNHCHGAFPALAVGIAHGDGTIVSYPTLCLPHFPPDGSVGPRQSL